jgi:hypothetical protein
LAVKILVVQTSAYSGPGQSFCFMPRVNLTVAEVQALIYWLTLQPNLPLSLASALAHFQDSLASELEDDLVLNFFWIQVSNWWLNRHP